MALAAVRLKKTAPRKKPEKVHGNPAFPTFEEVCKGTEVLNVGSLEGGTKWRVTQCWAFSIEDDGSTSDRRVKYCKHLYDEVSLVCFDTPSDSWTKRGEIRRVSFGTFKYGANWQISKYADED